MECISDTASVVQVHVPSPQMAKITQRRFEPFLGGFLRLFIRSVHHFEFRGAVLNPKMNGYLTVDS